MTGTSEEQRPRRSNPTNRNQEEQPAHRNSVKRRSNEEHVPEKKQLVSSPDEDKDYEAQFAPTTVPDNASAEVSPEADEKQKEDEDYSSSDFEIEFKDTSSSSSSSDEDYAEPKGRRHKRANEGKKASPPGKSTVAASPSFSIAQIMQKRTHHEALTLSLDLVVDPVKGKNGFTVPENKPSTSHNPAKHVQKHVPFSEFPKKRVDALKLLEMTEFNEELPSTSKMPVKARKPKRKSTRRQRASSESHDEDDWEDVGPIATEPRRTDTKPVKIELKREKQEEPSETKAGKWAKFIRQEIARKRRERVENCHKAHFLCFIAHLRFHISVAQCNSDELSVAVQQLLPDGLPPPGATVTPATMENVVGAVRRCVQQRLSKDSKPRIRTVEEYNARLVKMLYEKRYESIRDLAMILFVICRELRLPCRMCLAFSPMPRTETPKKTSATNKPKASPPAAAGKTTTTPKTTRGKAKASEFMSASSDDEDSDDDAGNRKKGTKQGRKKVVPKPRASVQKKSPYADTTSTTSEPGVRNYWIEYYDDSDERWISVDPAFGKVDQPEDIEKDAVKPMTYVIGVDNGESRSADLTARYASQFLTTQYRRIRVEDQWLTDTLALPLFRSNARRARAEDAEIRNRLLSRPMPAAIAEYKNHPLYVLKKDLLKYQGIYPPDIEPVGKIRELDVYPRSAVHHLQGELNWLKEGRSVRKGEEPYKVVNARPKMNIPKEQRVPLTLNVYGYWQTEPYEPPEVVNGRIPRNEHGNIYMYQDSMLPKGCAHLRLPGIYQIARKLDLEAVPAIIGWEFSGGGNHPTVDGCVVLEQDAEVLRAAWVQATKNKAEREKNKAQERIWTSWKRLIKGKLLLEKMRSRFKH
ncbi:DNA repair protein Rad4 containing protein [Aphelenchoides avenae]|nr:DNA repair protein Rad4 containing protein [Aphelenchus avenae]